MRTEHQALNAFRALVQIVCRLLNHDFSSATTDTTPCTETERRTHGNLQGWKTTGKKEHSAIVWVSVSLTTKWPVSSSSPMHSGHTVSQCCLGQFGSAISTSIYTSTRSRLSSTTSTVAVLDDTIDERRNATREMNERFMAHNDTIKWKWMEICVLCRLHTVCLLHLTTVTHTATSPSDCQCLRILENYIFRHFSENGWKWNEFGLFRNVSILFALIANDLCHDLIRYYCLLFAVLSATIASTTEPSISSISITSLEDIFHLAFASVAAASVRILFVVKERRRKKRRTRRKPLAGWVSSIVRVVHLHLTKDICTMIASLRRWIMAETRKLATATLVSPAPLHIRITREHTVNACLNRFIAAAASGSAMALLLMLSLANISRRSRNDFMHRTQISFHGTRNFGRQRPTISLRMCDCVATRPERGYLFAFWVRHTQSTEWTERWKIFLGLFVLATESNVTENSRRHRCRCVCLCAWHGCKCLPSSESKWATLAAGVARRNRQV